MQGQWAQADHTLNLHHVASSYLSITLEPSNKMLLKVTQETLSCETSTQLGTHQQHISSLWSCASLSSLLSFIPCGVSLLPFLGLRTFINELIESTPARQEEDEEVLQHIE